MLSAVSWDSLAPTGPALERPGGSSFSVLLREEGTSRIGDEGFRKSARSGDVGRKDGRDGAFIGMLLNDFERCLVWKEEAEADRCMGVRADCSEALGSGVTVTDGLSRLERRGVESTRLRVRAQKEDLRECRT